MNKRAKILTLVVVAAFVVLVLRLFHIQVIDDSYKLDARNNVLRNEIQFPQRGEVYDRHGEFLVQSIASYDLLAIPRDVKEFDTLALARIAGVTPEKISEEIAKARTYSLRRPSTIVKQMTLEAKLLFDEYNFPGFYTVYHTQRSYPRKIAGNLLGYISEVDLKTIQEDDFYVPGDYIGMSGVERAYENVLRGEKGMKVNVVDVHGMVKGPYMAGEMDERSIAGTPIISTLDAGLQALGEELLRGKVGSIIAIEPSTGEILMMVSSPGYDPDELVGRNRGNNYMTLLDNPRHPLWNRAVMSSYPPGSTFKMVNGLIALQEGVATPNTTFSCHGAYTVSARPVGCHQHFSPVNMRQAVQTSCNSYFCDLLRKTLDNPRYPNMKESYDKWVEYVHSFGFGHKLGSDFLDERAGNVPTREYYDKVYRGSWSWQTVISLAIGQGELGCTPLQMANLGAIIANRGYYYTPHVVRQIGDEPVDERFRVKQFAKVDSKHFQTFVDGMYDAVHKEGGTGRNAYVPGLDICGKTGTAQNPHGEDHGTFLCFAPKDNPRIAVSVYIEHAGFGSTLPTPIARLIVEQYLTGTLSDGALWWKDFVIDRTVKYPHYDNPR